jgi:hypothetical protein
MESLNEIYSKLLDPTNDDSVYLFTLKPIFNDHPGISWHKLHYDVVEVKNKKYFKFNGDDIFYPNSTMSYIVDKKAALLYYDKLITICGDLFDEDLLDYIKVKFTNNLNKASFYHFYRFVCYMFYYFINQLLHGNLIYDKITHKQFRKWCLSNKIYDETVKKSLINMIYSFKKIDTTNQHYNDIQIFCNLIVKDHQ